jgi:hypothetical protein
MDAAPNGALAGNKSENRARRTGADHGQVDGRLGRTGIRWARRAWNKLQRDRRGIQRRSRLIGIDKSASLHQRSNRNRPGTGISGKAISGDATCRVPDIPDSGLRRRVPTGQEEEQPLNSGTHTHHPTPVISGVHSPRGSISENVELVPQKSTPIPTGAVSEKSRVPVRLSMAVPCARGTATVRERAEATILASAVSGTAHSSRNIPRGPQNAPCPAGELGWATTVLVVTSPHRGREILAVGPAREAWDGWR